jgi:ABC-type glycerol-3-phosphate transport system substrate-binding protein
MLSKTNVNKYSNINSKYLANAMAFLGFTYYKFINDEGKEVYSFENTEEFKDTIVKLIQLKKEHGKYKE